MMAEVISPPPQTLVISQPRQIPQPAALSIPPSSSAPSLPPSASGIRSGHLNLDIFSPVNQNGSFEFDRVLKSGEVLKRTRKTKQWKKFYLVLRPNLLSMYKNSSEERLHKQISLSDLTAVAYLKDPKGRRQHVFGLFSPSRNYHIQAKDEKDARAWVELIRKEARIDEQEYEMFLGSPPTTNKGRAPGVEQLSRSEDEVARWEHERLGSSSPEAMDLPSRPSTTRDGIRIPGIRRDSVYNLDYSGNDLSDFSDAPAMTAYDSGSSVHIPQKSGRSISEVKDAEVPANSAPASRPGIARNHSQLGGIHFEQDEERVIWHGYLLCLKSKGGVRQWKKLWVVLRPKNLAFYKNEDEYAANLIIPLSNIISAVEIDPVSRSKSHCMQIIAEDKSYRLCATSEEGLTRCLGALKSQLARRKEARKRKAAITI